MAIPVLMPKLGMTMEEGTVVEWLPVLGDAVEKGRTLLVIESEKTEAEIEATVSGVLRHLYVDVGETVPCGTLLAALTETADETFDAEAFAAEHPPPEVASQPHFRAPRIPPAPLPRPARRAIAPAAHSLARKLEIDLDQVTGTGPGGRVRKEDVEAVAARRERLTRVAEGVSLEVLREGEGDPVLLLPGFGTDVSSFALQSRALAEQFSVIALNPRGVGLSDAPALPAYDVATAATDAASLLEEPTHVVGASLGAAAALELALAHPERVRSLTLITPFLEATPRLRAVVTAWCRMAAEASPAVLARALLPWLFSDRLLADDETRERTARGLIASVARISAQSLERTAAGLEAWSGTRADGLGDVSAATLVLAGGADLLTPHGESVAVAIPGARAQLISDAGHALAIDAGEQVSTALLEHLTRA